MNARTLGIVGVVIAALSVAAFVLVDERDDAGEIDARVRAPVEEMRTKGPPGALRDEHSEPLHVAPSEPERVAEHPRRAPPGAFRVVDTETGERITHGTILLSGRPSAPPTSADRAFRYLPPKKFGVRHIDNKAFPERLRIGAKHETIWVGAEGYAWKAHARQHGNVVELEPAGDLVLRLSGPATACAGGTESDDVEITLTRGFISYDVEGGSGRDRVSASNTVEYTSLPPGAYHLAVTTKTSNRTKQTLCEATIEIVAGTTTNVPVTWTDTATGELDVIIIHSADATFPDDIGLEIRDVVRDEVAVMASTRSSWELDEPGMWRYRTPCLTPGPYLVKIHGRGVTQRVEVTPDVLATCTFDVSDFAHIQVMFPTCAGSTNLPLVTWGAVGDPDAEFRRYMISGEFTVLVVPPIPTWIQVVGHEASSERIVVSAQPGQRHVVQVECDPDRARAVTFRITPSATSLDPGDETFGRAVTFEAMGHDGKQSSKRTATNIAEPAVNITFVVDTPGMYRLTYPDTRETLASIDVDITKSIEAPIEIQLP